MTKKTEVAIAILYRHGKYLLQLRDNLPNISFPGFWGFFGGHLEAGESPEIALQRELMEEISYPVSEATFFAHYADERVVRHVFYAPLQVELDQLILLEGWDMDFFTPEQIRQRDRYSTKAGEARPISPLHQKILLDFIDQKILTYSPG